MNRGGAVGAFTLSKPASWHTSSSKATLHKAPNSTTSCGTNTQDCGEHLILTSIWSFLLVNLLQKQTHPKVRLISTLSVYLKTFMFMCMHECLCAYMCAHVCRCPQRPEEDMGPRAGIMNSSELANMSARNQASVTGRASSPFNH